MAEPEPHTLITIDLNKLPPDARAYFDSKLPLPETVQFFEERVTRAGIMQRVAIGMALVVVGLVLIVPGIFLFIFPIRSKSDNFMSMCSYHMLMLLCCCLLMQ